jgi:RNA polymerase sigma-70 factor (ECF subfamily)
MESGNMRQVVIGSMKLGRRKGRPMPIDQTALTDSQIIDAVKRGRKEAYREIVERYKRRVYFIAVGLVGNPHDALDLSQEAFIRAYRNISSFDSARPFLPWFHAIIRNLCLDFLRRADRRREIPLDGVEVADGDPADREFREAMWEAIERLSPEQREIITLHYFQGLSYKEMADTLGKPIGTIMSSLYYARQRLKIILKGSMGGSSERGK